MSSSKRSSDEVLNVNVGGKKFAIRRTVLTADPQSKLTEWFKVSSTKTITQDKSGNFFLDRDGRTFRHVINYLRLKRDKQLSCLALPCKPDCLARYKKSVPIKNYLCKCIINSICRLMAEAEALKLDELKDMCFEMLSRYQREEMGYIHAFTKSTLHDLEAWNEDHRDRGSGGGKSGKNDQDENW